MRQTSPSLRIIGVDPGLAATGWGIVEWDGNTIRYLSHGCISTKPSSPQEERLLFIHREFDQVLEKWKPQLSAIETLYFGRNVSSAIPVAEARGIALLTLAQFGIPVKEFRPIAVKQGVVGQTVADKTQMQLMVKVILGLKQAPKPQHAADALALAICAARCPRERETTG